MRRRVRRRPTFQKNVTWIGGSHFISERNSLGEGLQPKVSITNINLRLATMPQL